MGSDGSKFGGKGWWVVLALWLWGLLAGCRSNDETLIRIDGSSTVYPITEAVAEEFLKIHPDLSIAIGVSGSGSGLAKLLVGETDIADASRPISPGELQRGQQAGLDLIELPVAYDGLSVVVHPANHWVDKLTVAELKEIWQPAAQGKLMRWNQIRPDFPDREIHLYGAGITSGTYDYFTEAIVGTRRSSRGDYTSSEDYNVLVQGVSTDPLALGYVGLAYYLENKAKLRAIPIVDPQNGTDKNGVMPTYDNVRNGLYHPLTRPLFVYLSQEQACRPAVRQFITFFLAQAPVLVKETGYVPFSPALYERVRQRFVQQRTGSLFAGKNSAGGPIDQLLN
jgi:phosphate transport system substrate-binding protein